jgi:predicted molibdopterin-dependent oxidoreductase YjgC
MSGFRSAQDLASLPSVRVTVDDVATQAPAIWTVADLLLFRGGDPYRRSAVTGAPRAPFCMMGVCFDCLVTVDGEMDRQGCLVRLRDGMTIQRQGSHR